MATLAQMYNGIYGPADPSLPPIPAQLPALSAPTPPAPPQMPTPSIQQMYEGIYGPATNAWAAQRGAAPANAPQPPSPPSPPQAPARMNAGYDPLSWGAFADAFPSTSRTQTTNPGQYQQVVAGPNGPLKDTERLMPSSPVTPGALTQQFLGPTTRVVQSVPYTNVQQSAAGVPLPRARPNTTGVIATYPTTGLGQQFSQAPSPTRIVINGANSYGSRRIAPTPAPLSQRPASVPSPTSSYSQPSGVSAVDALRSQGYSPADAYALANQQSAQRAYENANGKDTRSDYFKSVTGG